MGIAPFLKLLPAIKQSPGGNFWTSYDAPADTLYIAFKNPSEATDSELTEDDIIIRFNGKEVVGLTVLHASQR